MRTVITTDNRGRKTVFLVRDTDPDSAAGRGIPIGPPDFDGLDLEEVKKELNNQLVETGILTWLDVQKNPTALSGAVRSAMVGRIVELYKRQEAKHG
jgi:hypothetical protein